MIKAPIIVIGAGGHAKVVIDAIEQSDHYQISRVLDDAPSKIGQMILGYQITSFAEIKSLEKQYFIVAIGQDYIRRRKYIDLMKFGFTPVTIVHPLAVLSPHANIDSGCYVGANTVINPGADVKENTILNTATVIEHDVSIGAHSQISPAAVICGRVRVGEQVYIGANAVIRQLINIVSGTTIGAGAAVVKNITQAGTYVGCPAQRLERK